MSRVVSITGASSGIGRSTAVALAERGAALVLVARRRPELEELALVCTQRGASGVLVDRIVAPLVSRLASRKTRFRTIPGNVFHSTPEPEPAKDRA